MVEVCYKVVGAKNDYPVYTVYDKVTDSAKEKGMRIYACELEGGNLKRVLVDWEFLKILNEVSPGSSAGTLHEIPESTIADCEVAVLKLVKSSDFVPKIPVATLSAALLSA